MFMCIFSFLHRNNEGSRTRERINDRCWFVSHYVWKWLKGEISAWRDELKTKGITGGGVNQELLGQVKALTTRVGKRARNLVDKVITSNLSSPSD